MKYNARMFSIKYSKERTTTKMERKEKLQRKMQIAQTQFEQDVKRNWRIEEKAGAHWEKANTVIVRVRGRWPEYGKKSTDKIFFESGKEKSVFQKTHTEALLKWNHY